MTGTYQIDPLLDDRWEALLQKHRSATIFHTREWLQAIRQCYGYQARAVTTCPPGSTLTNALLYCRVQSWATGPRLVSAPFSDHCDPLVETEEQLELLLSRLKHECDGAGDRYLEIRSTLSGRDGMAVGPSFCLHRLDLRPDLSQLFHACHESCVRRKISKARREKLTYEEGVSEDLLQKFYSLLVLTRRRHCVPPQPLRWFRNLIACLGDRTRIRIASHRNEPAAGIVTIRYKSTMTYKYGGSDPRFHRFGPVQMLLWKAIEGAKNDGIHQFDLGRTAWDNEGLLTFKDHWGGERSTLQYLRYPTVPGRVGMRGAKSFSNLVFSMMPKKVLTVAGAVLYPHVD